MLAGAVLEVLFLLKRKKRKNSGGKAQAADERAKESGKSQIWLAVGFLILGMVFFLCGVGFRRLEDRKTESWEEVSAVVTDIRESSLHRRSRRSATLVTYMYQGKTYEDVDIQYTASDLNPGMTVTVLVNPDCPEEANVGSEKISGVTWPLMLVGGGIFLAGMLLGFRGILYRCGLLERKDMPSEMREKRERLHGKVFVVCMILVIAGVGFYFFGYAALVIYGIGGGAMLYDGIRRRK